MWVPPAVSVEQWLEATDHEYLAAYIKGSPGIIHARRPDDPAALCGRKPGPKSPYSSHRSRTGWMYFKRLSGVLPTCVKCAELIE